VPALESPSLAYGNGGAGDPEPGMFFEWCYAPLNQAQGPNRWAFFYPCFVGWH